MSQQDETKRETDVIEASQPSGPVSASANTTGQPEVEAEGATIGTGTSLALGCVAGTILLIVIGLIYILILALI